MPSYRTPRYVLLVGVLVLGTLSAQPGTCQETETIQNSVSMQFKLVPAGKFMMGSADNGPAHEVTLTEPYYIGVYEVTQAQFEQVMQANPSGFQGEAVDNVDTANHPVEKVSWDDAVEFCRVLSALPEEKAAGRTFRLPTEAEWENAARAGTTTEFYFGENDAELGEFAWYLNNGEKRTQPVGQKQPNPWGLYDMYGNVEEWCQDFWTDDYSAGPATNPTGPSRGFTRIRRGGGWIHYPSVCCSDFRAGSPPSIQSRTLGFRVVCVDSK